MEIRLKNTETANIEIIPDGEDIIIRFETSNKGSVSPANKQVSKGGSNSPKKTAKQVLDEFYATTARQRDVNTVSLKKFYDFYSSKTDTWRGEFDAEELWNRWIARERN